MNQADRILDTSVRHRGARTLWRSRCQFNHCHQCPWNSHPSCLRLSGRSLYRSAQLSNSLGSPVWHSDVLLGRRPYCGRAIRLCGILWAGISGSHGLIRRHCPFADKRPRQNRHSSRHGAINHERRAIDRPIRGGGVDSAHRGRLSGVADVGRGNLDRGSFGPCGGTIHNIGTTSPS